jgi:hypothetical protein
MEEKLAVFLAEVSAQGKEIEQIHTVVSVKAQALKTDLKNEDLAANLGYRLHNLYSAYEDLFKLVTSFFENQVDRTAAYHIGLLKRMRIEIEGVRPALISDETFALLDELRGFRHIFRHAYGYSLDADRLVALSGKAESLGRTFAADFKRFQQTLAAFTPFPKS